MTANIRAVSAGPRSTRSPCSERGVDRGEDRFVEAHSDSGDDAQTPQRRRALRSPRKT
ncbi:MAG TPA: hypothetical protein VHG10_09910 [Glycomyces sp.]|nr:hypothetical protein [Glycomyces sp.]